MWTKLRALIIADAKEDVILLLGTLHADGFLIEHGHVRTYAELEYALRSAHWDIVLARDPTQHCISHDISNLLISLNHPVPLIVISDERGATATGGDGHLGQECCITMRELRSLSSAVLTAWGDSPHRDAFSTNGQAAHTGSASDNVVAATSAGIMVIGQNGVVSYANPAAGRLFGLSTQDLVGRKTPIPADPEVETTIAEVRHVSDKPRTIAVQASRMCWGGEDSVVLTLYDITIRKQEYDLLKESFRDLAYTMSRAMASRDPYTVSHQRRVADLVVLVGARMGLSDGQLWDLRLGGLMHDIGKVAIPDEILAKPGNLASEELHLARTHSERGYDILRGARLAPVIAQMALHHHEALDGSGYPQQLHATALSIEDRILIPCNLAESISSFRLYRRALNREDTVARLQYERGTKHDPEVVDCLIEVLESGQFELGSLSVR